MQMHTVLPHGVLPGERAAGAVAGPPVPATSHPRPGSAPVPAAGLHRADLVARHRGVREDLRAAVARGEISARQSARFLARIEAALLVEQHTPPRVPGGR
ncbi:hypothetical protein [Rothia kristinae]|uniref:hypothetical protein n=1 Tax=Rothia kristinae TaxID=37923 RepID=UPI0021A8181C|nr:hypothetical protein [Rothia kristinae]MCT1506857.1 hypothetical protein [Rothia kristinae]MCT2246114.1 hypothetical protein [Rothia kristinae]MCT2324048.1 hypothetical protein [Rothia kristinae]WGH09824.1 hypothetical protein OU799_02635 [Rothia kristinae]